jgi:hypothetical protein
MIDEGRLPAVRPDRIDRHQEGASDDTSRPFGWTDSGEAVTGQSREPPCTFSAQFAASEKKKAPDRHDFSRRSEAF